MKTEEQTTTKQKVIKGITFGISFIVAYFAVQYLFFDANLEDKLKDAAQELNEISPQQIDQDTRLDSASTVSDKIFKYHYTLLNLEKSEINSEEFNNYMKPNLTKSVKTSSDLKEFRKHKITMSYNYFDKNGEFIAPFDYRVSGGVGARNYYGENNGWTYRWDVQHNVADLIDLMGGREAFIDNLDATFAEPMGRGKREFYTQLPDQTGNVGQFSMANEPSLHIPYLYSYAGEPWKTQKRIKKLIHTWFRNDFMGVPGDEDAVVARAGAAAPGDPGGVGTMQWLCHAK